MFRGALEAAEMHDIPHEVLDAAELRRRYPAYVGFEPSTRVVWQPDGGFLLAERTILAHVNGALAAGADLRFREGVVSWEPTADGGVRVVSERGTYEAGRLVICAGAWARHLVPRLADLAMPEREVLAWLQPDRPELFEPDRFPLFLVDVPEGSYYGFPVHDVPGFKFGWYHHFREPMEPDDPDRSTRPDDEAALRSFAERYFLDGAGPTIMLKACMFTNSPDEHFLIDRLADAPQVSVAAGFSGHGYKFCSVVGEIMPTSPCMVRPRTTSVSSGCRASQDRSLRPDRNEVVDNFGGHTPSELPAERPTIRVGPASLFRSCWTTAIIFFTGIRRVPSNDPTVAGVRRHRAVGIVRGTAPA
jgi:sarcosine oxidase